MLLVKVYFYDEQNIYISLSFLQLPLSVLSHFVSLCQTCLQEILRQYGHITSATEIIRLNHKLRQVELWTVSGLRLIFQIVSRSSGVCWDAIYRMTLEGREIRQNLFQRPGLCLVLDSSQCLSESYQSGDCKVKVSWQYADVFEDHCHRWWHYPEEGIPAFQSPVSLRFWILDGIIVSANSFWKLARTASWHLTAGAQPTGPVLFT